MSSIQTVAEFLVEERIVIRTVCRAEHIAIGSEILLGQIQNRHAQTISLEFSNHGLFIYHHTAVGDNLERMVSAFELASKRSNVVIVTGGLGPTVDDLTREALAQFLRRPLLLSDDAMHDLLAFFAYRNRPMPEENRKQAMCIEGGALLRNPNGTAPGQYVENQGVHYFLLPGPPLEMTPMLKNEVIPRLLSLFSDGQVLVSRVLHFCGIGESDVDEQIGDLTAHVNPTVAPLAGEGEMLLRITATGVDHAEALALIHPVEQSISARFPGFIYGVDEDTLPGVVGNALVKTGATLAVAESCTGGLISSMITAVPGSSSYMRGGVVAYDNVIKQGVLGVSEATLERYGAVSEQTAVEMADGVKSVLRADYGISVTGIAGPSGGTAEKPVGLVFGAVSSPSGTKVYRMQYRGSREQIRLRAAKHMLWRLWATVSKP